MDSSRTTVGRLAVLLSTGALTLSGCGLLHTENAAQTAPPKPPPPTTVTTSTTQPPPPRPFEMPLDHVDPCEILKSGQRSQLGFDRDPLSDSEGGFGNAPTCSFRNSKAKVGARLSLVTAEGMDVWTDDTAQVEARPVVIQGFPGLVIKTPDLNLACNVAVDVAHGQHLDVLYRDDGAQPPAPLDQLCAGAQRVATDAVKSLANPQPATSSTSSTTPPTSTSTTTKKSSATTGSPTG